MKKFGLPILVAFLPFTFLAQSQAAGLIRPEKAWTGTWQDGQGGVMSIQAHNRVLDISGKDSKSIYSMTCILQTRNRTATCMGAGINYVIDERFLYRSELTMNEGTRITENWEAILIGGKAHGKAVFEKYVPSSEDNSR